MKSQKMKVFMALLAVMALTVPFVNCGGGGGGGSSDDGKAYLYATDPDIVIDFISGVDYSATIDDWGSGATFNDAYALDADYNPCFSVTPGSAWGDAGAVAFREFISAGFASSYTALHFKFKGPSPGVRVSFPGATVKAEIKYYGITAADLGNGWYEYSIRLANHGDLAAVTEFGIMAFGDGSLDQFLLTDIYFDDSVMAPSGIARDVDNDGAAFLYGSDWYRELDLVYGADYTDFSHWGSGSAFADTVTAEYDRALFVPSGTEWGDAGCVAWYGFDELFASDYTTLNFKFKSSIVTTIQVAMSGYVTQDQFYSVADTSVSSAIANSWYQFSVPVSNHGAVATTASTTEFAFIGGDDFFVTDINFD